MNNSGVGVDEDGAGLYVDFDIAFIPDLDVKVVVDVYTAVVVEDEGVPSKEVSVAVGSKGRSD